MKNPMTPSGIEPATFRFAAQHINHCATVVPRRIFRFPQMAFTCPIIVIITARRRSISNSPKHINCSRNKTTDRVQCTAQTSGRETMSQHCDVCAYAWCSQLSGKWHCCIVHERSRAHVLTLRYYTVYNASGQIPILYVNLGQAAIQSSSHHSTL